MQGKRTFHAFQRRSGNDVRVQPDTGHKNYHTNYHNQMSLQIVTTNCYNK